MKKKVCLICFLALIGGMAIWIIASSIYFNCTTPDEYFVKTPNRIEYQSRYECGAYASAYLMRSFGDEIEAKKLYKEIENKNADGSINMKVVAEELEKRGYKVKLKFGTTERLKKEISKGKPVIVFLRIAPDSDLLHYLPIVGYDKDNYYACDSVASYSNCRTELYNRIIKKEDFKKMWNINIKSFNVYFCVSKVEEDL